MQFLFYFIPNAYIYLDILLDMFSVILKMDIGFSILKFALICGPYVLLKFNCICFVIYFNLLTKNQPK